MATLEQIVAEVNRRSQGRPLGTMQTFRKVVRDAKRLNRAPFDKVHHPDWTFHRGGREELQFNLGFEYDNPKGVFRYGVAFSLEPSRSMPSIDRLVPKIGRLNDYLRENPAEYADLWMWDSTLPGQVRRPAPLRSDVVRPGVFIFLGNAGNAEEPDYTAVMDTLDRLMPLYRHVEGGSGGGTIVVVDAADPPAFRPGCPSRPLRASATLAERTLDIELRHNAMQTQLHRELVSEFGYDHVGVEQPAPGGGGRIDVLVQMETCRIVYEIKTAMTARGCIRAAMGQILDYACWPNGPIVERLVIVGEPLLNAAEAAYLTGLNESFPRPIEYRSVALAREDEPAAGKLG